MSEPTSSFLNLLLSGGATAIAWIAGESGRVVVASGAGGMANWLNRRPHRIRDGVVAVTGGLLCGTYGWPAVFWISQFVPHGGMAETPNNIALAAFCSGAIGMSVVKIITAVVETKLAGAAGKFLGDDK